MSQQEGNNNNEEKKYNCECGDSGIENKEYNHKAH